MSVKMVTSCMGIPIEHVHQMVAGLMVIKVTQYVKVALYTIQCQRSQNHSLLHCLDTLVECTPLLNIPYGHVHYSSIDTTKIEPGDVVTYSCDPPYLLHGVEYRICMSNGSWSEEEPQCTGKMITSSKLGAVII